MTLYLDYRRLLVPDKWHGASLQQNLHTKERCGGGTVGGHGCGLWKLKGKPCPHCQLRPNRKQAKVAQAHHVLSDRVDKWGFRDPTPEKRPSTAALEVAADLFGTDGPKAALHRRAASHERLAVHTKERCGGGNVGGFGCGMWITRGQPCPHCSRRPNRQQALTALERQEQEDTPFQEALRRQSSKWQPATFMQNAARHTKERCGGGAVGGHGCGLWKERGKPCPHCETRPNRVQARLAQATMPRIDMAALGLAPLALKCHPIPPSVRDDVEYALDRSFPLPHGPGAVAARLGRPRSAPSVRSEMPVSLRSAPPVGGPDGALNVSQSAATLPKKPRPAPTPTSPQQCYTASGAMDGIFMTAPSSAPVLPQQLDPVEADSAACSAPYPLAAQLLDSVDADGALAAQLLDSVDADGAAPACQ